MLTAPWAYPIRRTMRIDLNMFVAKRKKLKCQFGQKLIRTTQLRTNKVNIYLFHKD